ncbi:MAG: SDR family oxidoreductase [Alphaproteobacteria bacterium]|nr:SDR family oxidoreductase [Alphaproteobacteria bacterium]
MDLQLKGKTALVTGASRGIGAGTARVLAAEGCRVAITARRGELLEGLADSIAKTGVERPAVMALDLAGADAPGRLKDAIGKAFGGRLDILVNNAGAALPAPLDAPESLWEEALALNFTAVRRVTGAFAPGMIERKFGRVINITGTMEPFGVNAATAAKAAVQAWAKGLSRDLGKHGVTVNCIIPGRIKSEQNTRAYPTEEAEKKFSEAHIPVGYFGAPEEVGYLVAFVASPLARLITGSVMYVDGGMKRFSH